MTTEAAVLRREIEARRMQLDQGLGEIEALARDVTDWRAQVRAHPAAAMRVAAASGVALALLLDRRQPRGRTDSAPSAMPPMSHPVVDRLIDALVTVATTAAMDYLGTKLPGDRDGERERHADHREPQS